MCSWNSRKDGEKGVGWLEQGRRKVCSLLLAGYGSVEGIKSDLFFTTRRVGQVSHSSTKYRWKWDD